MPRGRWTVGAKLLLPLLAVGTALVAAGAYLSHRLQAARLERQMLARAQVIADAVKYAAEVYAPGSAPESVPEHAAEPGTAEPAEPAAPAAPVAAIGGRDPAHSALIRMVNALGGERDVDVIAVVGSKDGREARVLACTREGWIGRPVQAVPQAEVRRDLSEALGTRRPHGELAEDRSAYQFTVPLDPLASSANGRPGGGAVRGAVTVRLDARGARAELAAVGRLANTLRAAFIVAIGSLNYVLLRRVVLRRVVAICAAIDRRTAGDSAARAPVCADGAGVEGADGGGAGGDEIDAVAATLNKMIDTMAAAEARLQRMIDSSADCIQTLDLGGRLLTINSCGQRLMEIEDLASVAGKEWVEFWGGGDRAAAEQALGEARAGRVGRFEGYCPTAGGKPKWWHVVVSPIADASGNPERLLSVSRDVTDRHAAEERLRHASLHDGLTGLPNRVLFLDRVERCLERSRREAGYHFAVLFLDLDRFKFVNDSLGHAAGDKLLAVVAERLAGCLRNADSVARAEGSAGSGGSAGSAGSAGGGAGAEGDRFAAPEGATGDTERVVARLGGDEFTLLLDGLRDPADAARVAERVLSAVARPVAFDGQEVVTAASLGIVVGGPGYDSAADVLRDADAAMYKAKGTGRNRYAVFDDTLHEAAVNRLRLEADLRRAVERGELLLHYQPIVCLQTRAVVGFEALVRWRREGRLVPPLEFIPVAEETGLIIAIGRWVLEEACRQVAGWRAHHRRRPVTVSVNVSGKQLCDPDLLPHLRRVLADTGLDPAALKLEITESAVMEDPESAGDVLRQIKSAGVSLSMDDFGTGYSSLSCLHRFALGELKLDRGFIANLESRRDAAAVVNAVVSLAHHLGMKVVAEGLEQPGQVAFLQVVGCDYGQGYIFAKPLPADAAGAFLARDQETAAAA